MLQSSDMLFDLSQRSSLNECNIYSRILQGSSNLSTQKRQCKRCKNWRQLTDYPFNRSDPSLRAWLCGDCNWNHRQLICVNEACGRIFTSANSSTRACSPECSVALKSPLLRQRPESRLRRRKWPELPNLRIEGEILLDAAEVLMDSISFHGLEDLGMLPASPEAIRPSGKKRAVLTRAIYDRLHYAFESLAHIQSACHYAGISVKTFHRWIQQGVSERTGRYWKLVKMYRRTIATQEVDIIRKVRNKATGSTADAYKAGLGLLKTVRPELYNPTFIASAHNNQPANNGQTINIQNLSVETMNNLPLPERKAAYEAYMQSKGQGRIIDAKPQLALPDPDSDPDRWMAELKASRAAAGIGMPDLSSLTFE